MYKTTAIYYTS